MMLRTILYMSVHCLFHIAVPSPMTDFETLSVTHLEKGFIEASYTVDNVCVNFLSTPTVLSIKDENGIMLVSAEQFLNKMTVAVVGERGFIHTGRKGYVISKGIAMEVLFGGLLKESRILEMLLWSALQYDVKEQLKLAIEGLMVYKEINLLSKVSLALARKGITGSNTPSILPLYKFALQMEKFKSKQLARTAANSTTGDSDDCFDSCPPCPDEDCLGLCGWGCFCWKFVCGDCCFHLGCYDHDVCCRQNLYDVACLFPFGFKCEENYYC